MTVTISKPAINIREQLTELKAQQGYEERQFHFDNLVTNGTFDTDLSGWADPNSGWSQSGGAAVMASTGDYKPLTQDLGLVAGETYVITFDVTAITGVMKVALDSASPGISNTSINTFSATGSHAFTVTPEAGETYLVISRNVPTTSSVTIDNISVYTSDGTDVAFTMPKGWKPLHVYDDGVLQREGAAHDYEVVYDGFDYYVKPAVAPSATTQTCVIGVRA